MPPPPPPACFLKMPPPAGFRSPLPAATAFARRPPASFRLSPPSRHAFAADALHCAISIDLSSLPTLRAAATATPDVTTTVRVRHAILQSFLIFAEM